MCLDSPAPPSTVCLLPAPSLQAYSPSKASWPQPPERPRGAELPGKCRVRSAPFLSVSPACLHLIVSYFGGCQDLSVFGVVPMSVCMFCLVALGLSGPACHLSVFWDLNSSLSLASKHGLSKTVPGSTFSCLFHLYTGPGSTLLGHLTLLS